MNKTITCILCPNGCEIEVEYYAGGIKRLSGNLCERGEEYAKKEIYSPERGLTTTVLLNNGETPLISVKTSKPIPKEKIFNILDEVSKVRVDAPVKIGDVIIKNVLGTGADIVATKNMRAINDRDN